MINITFSKAMKEYLKASKWIQSFQMSGVDQDYNIVKDNDHFKYHFKEMNPIDLTTRPVELLSSVGFICLAIGILSGTVWANETWGSY